MGLRWNCMLLAKGARCEVLKARCFGRRSDGRGPSAAKLDRLSAVMTTTDNVSQRSTDACKRDDEPFRSTVSWVASTYRLCPSGNVAGSSLRVALVEELCTEMGV